MEKFISLEEFLLLKDPHRTDCSLFNIDMPANKWVEYYNCAKANWEKFGDSGPPEGTEVITLKHGHGGGMGEKRIVGETTNKYECGPHIVIIGNPPHDEPFISIAELETWWVHISSPELVDRKFFRW